MPAINTDPNERIIFVSFSVNDVREEIQHLKDRNLAEDGSEIFDFADTYPHAAFVEEATDADIYDALRFARERGKEFYNEAGEIYMPDFADLVRHVQAENGTIAEEE